MSEKAVLFDIDAGAENIASHEWNFEKIISQLRASREVTYNIRQKLPIGQLPSRTVLTHVVDLLSIVLFPSHFGRRELAGENVDYLVGSALNEALGLLSQQVRHDLAFSLGGASQTDPRLAARTNQILRSFAAQLPDIRAKLVKDLHAAYRGDPAATNYPEILLGYPGMTAILYYRLARALFVLGAALSARMIGHIAHSKTAIDIHPGADIGSSLFIDHGTGVVIGETAIIGNRVRLYQAVTLGARNFQEGENGVLVKGQPRHPIVEDDVVIYAGATILGRVTIGRGSVIGGNVWLTKSVDPGSNITQAQSCVI
jgi:serine O-acetyltransferase